MVKKEGDKELVIIENIQEKIYTVRGVNVMLDRDLAELYGVKTMHLNQQRSRNKAKFPEDFAFQLTTKEFKEVITKCDNLKFSSKCPWVYTLRGANQLATVLKSQTATERSIFIIRAFSELEEKGLILPEGSGLDALELYSKQLQQQANAIVALVSNAKKAEVERKELRSNMSLIENEVQKTQYIVSEIDRKAALSRIHQLGTIVGLLSGGGHRAFMKVWGGYRGKWGFKYKDTPMNKIEPAENDFLLQIVTLIDRFPEIARSLEVHHVSFLATYDINVNI